MRAILMSVIVLEQAGCRISSDRASHSFGCHMQNEYTMDIDMHVEHSCMFGQCRWRI